MVKTVKMEMTVKPDLPEKLVPKVIKENLVYLVNRVNPEQMVFLVRLVLLVQKVLEVKLELQENEVLLAKVVKQENLVFKVLVVFLELPVQPEKPDHRVLLESLALVDTKATREMVEKVD